jgi:pimeloyl-ACP methyl ester carboxylesterase
MSRWLKVLVAVLAAIAVLLILNTVVLDHQTKEAGVTVDGGTILPLAGGDLQAIDTGAGAPIKGKPPIVLLHCYTCSINWWGEMIPLLRKRHRVIAIDLLGHGGSAKPRGGYSIENQAQLVAEALARLGVKGPVTVVGHSLGGAVATALAEQSPRLVGQVVILDSAPDTSFGSLDLLARALLTPVIGEAMWRLKVDKTIRSGLEQAFAPGYDVPDKFVDDVKRMTYSSYNGSHDGFDSYVGDAPLDGRLRRLRIPLLAIFGAEDQIVDARRAIAAYAAVPDAQTALIQGSGHSPNVEKPTETERLIERLIDSTKVAGKPQPNASSIVAQTAGPAVTAPCGKAIIGAGPPDWRKVAVGMAGRFGIGSKKALPGGLAHAAGGRVGEVFPVQLQALVEGHEKVVLRVPASQHSRVGLIYGPTNGARTLAEAARQVTFKPCPDKPRTVWPGGLALVTRGPVTLDVVAGNSVKRLRLG